MAIRNHDTNERRGAYASNAPKGYCCIPAYDAMHELKWSVLNTVWVPTKRKELVSAQERLAAIDSHHQAYLENGLQYDIVAVRTHLAKIANEWSRLSPDTGKKKNHAGLLKKIGTGLLLGFLSVSTIRYWMNVVYPQVQEYGLRKAIAAQCTLPGTTTPQTPRNPVEKSLEQILQEKAMATKIVHGTQPIHRENAKSE